MLVWYFGVDAVAGELRVGRLDEPAVAVADVFAAVPAADTAAAAALDVQHQ